MTECRSPELQDLLPDFVADVLDDADQARLTAHLAECEACTSDVSLLRLVRAARPAVSSIDVTTIVAALPKPPATAAVTERPALTVQSNRDIPARPRSTPRRETRIFGGPALWRTAAAVGVVLAGGMSMVIARRGLVAVSSSGTGPAVVAESATVVAIGAPTAAAPVESTPVVVATPTPTPRRADVSVSYGDLGDLSEDELQRLLDRLDQWDGAPSTEPMPNLPLVQARGGNTP